MALFFSVWCLRATLVLLLTTTPFETNFSFGFHIPPLHPNFNIESDMHHCNHHKPHIYIEIRVLGSPTKILSWFQKVVVGLAGFLP